MSQGLRLPEGGRIDRRRALRFPFNGRVYEGYAGDTVASALLANGVALAARSIKYHRPRGLVGIGPEEPNVLLQVGRGAATLPNQRATEVMLADGLECSTVNGWPSVRRDLMAAMQLGAPLMTAGFYYKTFKAPARAWPWYERLVRRAAGTGYAPDGPDPDVYERVNAHCDVLVAGAGPAGLAAALVAARAGARVIVADEQSEPGGWLLQSGARIDGRPAMEWVAETVAELRRHEDVTLLPAATVFGRYHHGLHGILERTADRLGARYWRVRARHLVLATGALERPIAFGDNDRPGVLTAGAVTGYLRRYAVAPHGATLVFGNHDGIYGTAVALADADLPVAGGVDVRTAPGPAAEAARERGMVGWFGAAGARAHGRRRVEGATLTDSEGGSAQRIDCGTIAVSGGWEPALHPSSHSGLARPAFHPGLATFVPGDGEPDVHPAGAVRAVFDLADCLRDGERAGASAAEALGLKQPPASAHTVTDEEPNPAGLAAFWASPPPRGRKAKAFVDLQNDITTADIRNAVNEGYRSIEHVKRYSVLGYGTDQGRLGNIVGAGIAAGILGEDLGEVGTTTYRPPYTPVPFGALVAAERNELVDPVRVTPMHDWHMRHGAVLEDVGQWQRARYYPRPGEDMDAAVRRECLATHRAVGVLDYSTLGKIDIQGPDAAELLDRVYTNGWKKLAVGRARYGLMLDENGMVFDDGLTVRLAEHRYLMHTTTGGAARVLAWLERWLQTEWPGLRLYLTSVTDAWATVSIAGPESRLLPADLRAAAALAGEAFPFMYCRHGTVAGVPARLLRVSFSGELCYEITVSADYGLHLWEAVMAAGERFDATPYGTETMHVLRAEKGFIIAGQDTDGSISPLDLGMAGLVGRHKDCLGKRSLARPDLQRDDRPQFVGLVPDDPEQVIPEGAQLVAEPDARPPAAMHGYVTSSYYGARIGRAFALGLVNGGRARHGERLWAWDVDRGAIAARIAPPVFFDPKGERQHV